MTEPSPPELKERWEALPARQRGALIRAVRRGDEVSEPDRALAAHIAQRELDRVTNVVRPGRLTVWRVFQALAAVVAALAAVTAVVNGDILPALLYGTGAVLFGTSALLARRRLARQVGRLVAARDANS
ncbi:MAG TPA: hypothetical protein VNA20_07235 [Frankiaceae bacterium]|nr:hypothetical protein [Frankiaceae bacterium]